MILYKTIQKEINPADLQKLVSKLVRRPSEQTDQLEYEPAVKNFISELLMNEFKARGLNDVKLDEMGNLICRIGRKQSGKRVFFLAYAMTHPASSMDNPFGGELKKINGENVIRGRGISEQKGALAGMIAASEYINNHSDDLDGELIFAVSLAGETGRHDAVHSIKEDIGLQADLGVVGIGTNNEISQGNKGRVDILVNVYGKSCHSSTPSEGINAIEGAAAVIDKLKALTFNERHPKLGKPTLTSTAVRSFPEATHTIQHECRLVFDRRLLPGNNVDKVVDEIKEAIGNMDPFSVEVKKGPVTYPSEVSNDSIIMTRLGQAIKDTTNQEPGIFYSNGAIDAGYLNECSIPSVMFGPGNMNFWHTDNEVLSMEDLLKGAWTYTQLAFDYLRKV